MGGPEKGLRLFGSIGELTEVASAKRAVLGVLMERVDDELEVRGRTATWGPFFSSTPGAMPESSVNILALT